MPTVRLGRYTPLVIWVSSALYLNRPEHGPDSGLVIKGTFLPLGMPVSVTGGNSMNNLFFLAVILLALGLSVAPVPADNNGNTHFDMPFIHVHKTMTASGRQHVVVRAPFVHVDNPPGYHNAKVKAPFTHVNP
jgi:hypothetical protein